MGEIMKLLTHLLKKQAHHVIAVACAHDEDVLQAVIKAKNARIADAILVGNQQRIEALLSSLHAPSFTIIHEIDDHEAVKKCIQLIKMQEATILMKGLVDTSVLLKYVVSTAEGLKASPTLAHVSLIKVDAIDRYLILSDAAMNIAPTLETKKHIIEHCVHVAQSLHFEPIRVGVICAVEKVNPKMPCTLDAVELKAMNNQGILSGCIVDGPFALDNALSVEAAQHKGIRSEIAGLCNVLIMPNIEAGNMLYKSITYLSSGEVAGVVMGAKVPIVVTSRADSDVSKLNSIMLAAIIAQHPR